MSPAPPSDNDCGTSDAASTFDSRSWIIAVILAMLAALINNVGVNLQKFALNKKEQGKGT